MNRTLTKLYVSAGLLAVSGVAMADAATDTAVTGAMTSAGTSVGLYGAAMVGLALLGIGFTLGIKYIKKIPRVA